MANFKVTGKLSIPNHDDVGASLDNAKTKCEKLKGYVGYKAGDYQLDAGKYFSDYQTIILIYQTTGNNGGEWISQQYPYPVFTDTNRRFTVVASREDVTRFSSIFYVNNNTIRIKSGENSYIELMEIWGLR